MWGRPGGVVSRHWDAEEAQPESAGLEVCPESKTSEMENGRGFPRTHCVPGLS